jgi:uncharacterized membrane protein
MSLVWKIMATILVVVYPLAIYFGIQHFEPKVLALFLLAILILRLISSNQTTQAVANSSSKYLVFTAGLILMGISFYFNSLETLKLYPVLVNLSLLILFAASLYFQPSMIERLARMQEPDLSEHAVRYTRKVTIVWCIFFICNGSIAFYTALFSSNEIWTLYNGLISYILMGVLFLSEFAYRKLVAQKNH